MRWPDQSDTWSHNTRQVLPAFPRATFRGDAQRLLEPTSTQDSTPADT